MFRDWHSKSFTFNPDCDAYFRRIGYSGCRKPTVDTLTQIQWYHSRAVPYENLNMHINSAERNELTDLSPSKIQEKILFQHRGGYCFEQNILAMHVLRQLGFEVTPVPSRTIWRKPEHIVQGETHLVLMVTIEGCRWLFDVGFSSFGSPYPLKIDTEEVQETALEKRRILKTPSRYIHQMFAQNKWSDIYSFTLNESFPMDWEIGNFFVFASSVSGLKHMLIVSIMAEDRRYLIANNTFSISYLDGTKETNEISSDEELLQLLDKYFGLSFPAGTTFTIPPELPK